MFSMCWPQDYHKSMVKNTGIVVFVIYVEHPVELGDVQGFLLDLRLSDIDSIDI